MDRLKHIKESLIDAVQSQVSGNLRDVNAKELGEAVDMIKDIEEAMYYCTIVEAMEESEEESERAMKFTYPPIMYNGSYMTMDDRHSRYYHDWPDTMYYDGNKPYLKEMRDYREGKSPIMRKNYMESKELHHDKAKQMQELEKYMSELTQDIMEMIAEATIEEKQILAQKLATLSSKIK